MLLRTHCKACYANGVQGLLDWHISIEGCATCDDLAARWVVYLRVKIRVSSWDWTALRDFAYKCTLTVEYKCSRGNPQVPLCGLEILHLLT